MSKGLGASGELLLGVAVGVRGGVLYISTSIPLQEILLSMKILLDKIGYILYDIIRLENVRGSSVLVQETRAPPSPLSTRHCIKTLAISVFPLFCCCISLLGFS